MVVASGLFFPTGISDIYLSTPAQPEFQRPWANVEMDRLRLAARKYMKFPDWFLEFEMDYGDNMLVAGMGATDAIQTAKLEDMTELFFD